MPTVPPLRSCLLWVASFLIAVGAVSPLSRSRAADALARLQPERLEKWRSDRLALRNHWRPIQQPFVDVRANFHVHSHWSHDSRGTLEEIVAAAKRVATEAIFFTEHPSPKFDYFQDGHNGLKDGILLFPGAETTGFLAFPTRSLRGAETSKPQEFADLITRSGGLAFLSHPEERLDWSIRGLTGMEIYNTHALFKDQKKLISSLKNPFYILKLENALKNYPQECFSALHDYPSLYLKRWDELTQVAPMVGISANDAHQNVGIRIVAKPNGKAKITDALDEPLLEIDQALLKPFLQGSTEPKPDQVLFRLQLDPYEYSLGHVATHLLTDRLDRDSVWAAAKSGRAFVSFDWIANAKGFGFHAVVGEQRVEMGSSTPFRTDLQLRAQAPLSGKWKLVRNGSVIATDQGDRFSYVPKEPGVYRLEVWQNLGGEDLLWILSNPIYVK